METAGQRKYITTWVSADGRHAAASISTKPGAGGDEQPFNTEDGRYMAFTVGADGGISGGNEVRGKVSPPRKDKYPPPPPAPKEPHLTYSQSSGGLTDAQGALAGKGYSGKGDAKTAPNVKPTEIQARFRGGTTGLRRSSMTQTIRAARKWARTSCAWSQRTRKPKSVWKR